MGVIYENFVRDSVSLKVDVGRVDDSGRPETHILPRFLESAGLLRECQRWTIDEYDMPDQDVARKGRVFPSRSTSASGFDVRDNL